MKNTFFSKLALAIALLVGTSLFVSADRTPVTPSSSGSATSTFGFITATTTTATSTFAGDVYITGNLRVTGNFFAPVAISAASDIKPSADITYSLGTNALRWLNTYTQNIFATSSVITNATSTNFFTTTGSSTNWRSTNASSTYDTVISGLYTSYLTSGSIPYVNSSKIISEQNSNLFWDATNFRLGINTASPAVSLSVATGSIAVSEYAWGTATSTTMTVDWKRANTQNIRISTAGVTITQVNATTTPGAVLKLVVCNPTSGTAGTITWGNPIYWTGGTAPTQTTTANHCDVWSFLSTNSTSTAVIFGSQTPNF